MKQPVITFTAPAPDQLRIAIAAFLAGYKETTRRVYRERAGIELPAMYRLGYGNNNCIGCVKGGQGYWNRIRVDFPEVFERMSQVEQSLGRSVIRKDGKALPLIELDPKAGRFEPIKPADCDLNCQAVENEWQDDPNDECGAA